MTLKQFLNRPVRIFVLVACAGLPLMMSFMTRQVSRADSLNDTAALEFTNMFVWVIAAGVIGQDVSDGILPLVFSRPVKRYEYVISKWITVSLIASVCAIIMAAVNTALYFGFTPQFFEHFKIIIIGSQSFVMAMGLSAVMVLLSALLPGAADVGVVALLSTIAYILMIMQSSLHVPGMGEVSKNIFNVFYPKFMLEDINTFRDLFTYEVGRYFVITTGCITGAIAILNQKEFSYGSD